MYSFKHFRIPNIKLNNVTTYRAQVILKSKIHIFLSCDFSALSVRSNVTSSSISSTVSRTELIFIFLWTSITTKLSIFDRSPCNGINVIQWHFVDYCTYSFMGWEFHFPFQNAVVLRWNRCFPLFCSLKITFSAKNVL